MQSSAVKCDIFTHVQIGDPSGDRHPREGSGTSAAAFVLGKNRTEGSDKGAQLQGDGQRGHFYSQRRV